MNKISTLPFESSRTFSIHLYWASHGLLLIRSGKSKEETNRIDILFQDVRWLNLPTFLNGIKIEIDVSSTLRNRLTKEIQNESDLMTVFRITSQDVPHHILASQTFQIAEDDKNYHEGSSLLPNFDFQAFPKID